MKTFFDRAFAGFARATDRAAVAAVGVRQREGRAWLAGLGADGRRDLLTRVTAALEVEDGALFPAPRLEDVRVTPLGEVAPGAGVVSEAVAFRSRHVPLLADQASRFDAEARNHVARARRFRVPHGPPRPTLIALHGYLGGAWPLEERRFPIRRMVRGGLDVVLLQLPFHGERASYRRGPPPLPGPDVPLMAEAFRQAAHDVRALLAFARDGGAPAVGLLGVSLGGYVASLVATLEPVDFLLPFTPLASVADVAFLEGWLASADERDRLEVALGPVSPFARAPRVPSERVLVAGARADGVTPFAHAERLAAHFDAELRPVTGGHVLPFSRVRAVDALSEMIARLGLIEALPAG